MDGGGGDKTFLRKTKTKEHYPKKDTTRKDTLCMTVLQQYLRRNASKEEQQNVV